MAAQTWRVNLASVYERRTGPRTIAFEPTLAPWSRYHSVLPGQAAGPQRDQFIRTKSVPGPLPSNDADIAFAPVTQLSRWIEQRKLTSERLTQIYLHRIEQFDPKLRCVITLTRDLALAQAKKADRKLPPENIVARFTAFLGAARIFWTPLESPPPMAPSRSAIAFRKDDAAVVKRLHAAGAVLIAKLSLGALALNDIWFGGQTVNPWLLEEGASGSSAGPAPPPRQASSAFPSAAKPAAASSAPACVAASPGCAPPTAACPAPAP